MLALIAARALVVPPPNTNRALHGAQEYTYRVIAPIAPPAGDRCPAPVLARLS